MFDKPTFLLFVAYFFHIFLCLPARDHDLMPAPHAPQPEIRSDPEHLPLSGSTGMLLFQFENISYLNIHIAPMS
jgi:hypothetical protein